MCNSNCKHKWEKVKSCRHPEHDFPKMLLVPAGQIKTHTCPSCGQKTIVKGSEVSLEK